MRTVKKNTGRKEKNGEMEQLENHVRIVECLCVCVCDIKIEMHKLGLGKKWMEKISEGQGKQEQSWEGFRVY